MILSYVLGLLLGTALVSIWSYRRGTGFWFGLFWSFLLSPVIGAVLLLVRPRCHVLARGGTEIANDPTAPRPNVCMALTVVIFIAIIIWINT